ncbi:MAG: hypothetical protein E7222_13605 [Clostridiales bacterium]|jgi:organic radical activating enzyme|nr:hypothetical protein [Clostridiales bacterium]
MITTASMEITTKIGCKIDCKYCPQDLLLKNYHKEKEDRASIMTMELYKKCINKIPLDVKIVFSGMCEPWLNPNCSDMVLYAFEKGYKIDIFTTLVGMTKDDFKKIEHIPFGRFDIHIPDDSDNSNIAINDQYLDLLEYVINVIQTKSKTQKDFCCHGKSANSRLNNIVKDQFYFYNEMFDRAGNLEWKELDHYHIDKSVFCVASKRNFNQNILMPDGTVLLCCMDYGMKNVLGNLQQCNYEDLFTGEAFNNIQKLVSSNNSDVLCKHCHNGRIVNEEQDIYDVIIECYNLKDELGKTQYSCSQYEEKLLQTNKYINLLNKDLEEKNQNIDFLALEIENKEQELLSLTNSFNDRLEYHEKNRVELENNLREIKNNLQNITNSLIETENNLENMENELNRIKSSRSWRYMEYIWQLRDIIIPHNSKRRKLVKKLINRS